MANRNQSFTAAYQKVKGGFVGWIEEISGVNTQGKTLNEARDNLADALSLVVETNRLIAQQEARNKHIIREPFAISI